MESLAQSSPLSYHHHTHGSAMPVTLPKPEPAPIATGSKPQLLYRCLLNHHAQKMRKSLPIFQTLNEGFDHLPKFRSTVLFDGVSYTSSNTFPNLKMAEMDVSQIAYIAMTQKSKSEALRHIQKDLSICKSIMIEFSVKMKFERPKYVTSNQGGPIPVFSSYLSFNGATFPGGNAKSKKEAEQLAARAVIHKYLDSEFANDMAEVINCKFRHAPRIEPISQPPMNLPTGLAPLVVTLPPMIEPISQPPMNLPTRLAYPVATQPPMIEPISQPPMNLPSRLAYPVVTQPPMIEPITPAAPVVTQSQTAKVVTEPLTPAAPVVTQPLTSKVMTKPIAPTAPVVTHPLIPKAEPITPTTPMVTQPCIPKIEPITHPTATVVTHPCIPKIEPITPLTATVVTRSRIPKVSTEPVSKTVPVVTQPRQGGIRSAVISRPAVLAPTPSAQVNMVASTPRSGQLASNLSLDRSVEHKRLTLQTPRRKRYWEDNKDAQKKMRVDTQRPVPGMHTSSSQSFRPQSSLSKGNNSRMPHKNAFRR